MFAYLWRNLPLSKTRVMLVDDHKLVRAGLRLLINQEEDLEVVAEAASIQEARSELVRAAPDLVVMDLSLPGGGSLDWIRELAAKSTPPKVLVLTMYNEPPYARAAFAAGAHGYVVKTVAEDDLLTALRIVKRGGAFIDLDDEARTASVFGQPRQSSSTDLGPHRSPLSPRELQVLAMLGAGHTNQAIAEALALSPKTVATYRARITEKLGLKTIADFVRYAQDLGIQIPPRSDELL